MNCESVKQYYYEYLEQESSVPADVSVHLSQCQQCREEIERLREALGCQDQHHRSPEPEFLQLHYRLLDQWASCDAIKPLLPSLLTAVFSTKNQTPVTAHIENCCLCQKNLDDIVSLQLSFSQLMSASRYLAGEEEGLSEFGSAAQDVLKGIAAQRHRDVLTRMSLVPQSADPSDATWISDSYTVDVKHRVAKTPDRRPTRSKLAVPTFVTGGIAAAILFVIMLTLPPTAVKGLDLAQVYQSLEDVKNVHIQVFSEDLQEIRNIWISEGLQARLFQQEESTVYWDERTGEIYQKDADLVQLVSQIDGETLDRPWGLLPFNHISELPVDWQWGYVADAVIDGLQVQIYELTWQEPRSNQQSIQKKWRGYLDIHTHLPYRIEWTEKADKKSPDIQWIMEVRYPTDAECLETIQQDGFRLISYGTQADLFEMVP